MLSSCQGVGRPVSRASMHEPSPVPVPAPASRGGGNRFEAWLSVLVVLGVVWFYGWTIAPEGGLAPLVARDDGYNNLLVRGMLKGHLWLDLPADPFLATLRNPYDPVQRAGHGLHDASYYGGRYYVYFGVTPVALVFLPARLLTGRYVPDSVAVMGFALAGYGISVLLLRSMVRRRWPGVPRAVLLMGTLVLGLANMVPPLLRRPDMWEVPISCAYALFMLVLYALWRALADGGSPRWTALASLAMGLCIGARPSYLAGAVVLLAPLWLTGRRAGWGGPGVRRLLAATFGPVLLVGAGLAAYNYLRFGNPLEFGQTYQLSGAEERALVHFSLRYFVFNLRVYLFALPGLSPYFPFLTVATLPPVPPGQFGVEDPYGILPGMPWLLLVVPALWLAWRRRGAEGTWLAWSLIGIGLVAATIFCFGGNTGRYEVDFTPGLVLVATVGAARLLAETSDGWHRRTGLWVCGVLAVWSASFNVLLSLQHNRLLQLNHPAVYARVARAFNHLPYWFDRLRGWHGGPVELRVIFNLQARGEVEPLVVTGREFLSDYVYVHYVSADHIRFGLEHTSRGSWVGPEMKIDPAAAHTVVVQMGSLFPPLAYPHDHRLTEEEIWSRTRLVRVFLDGRLALAVNSECYDATEREPSIGTSGPNRPGFKRDFSGRILSWHRVAQAHAPPVSPSAGLLHLRLQLPKFTRPRSEPLLCSGVRGRGDLLYLTYVDARHIVVGHDHWGYGGSQSPPVPIGDDDRLDLLILCPPLLGEGSPNRLGVALNGARILDVEEMFYPCDPGTVAVGFNSIGASTAGAEFTGQILLEERLRKWTW